MIDPSDVIKFDRTDAELQEWWLFSTVVAGKTAATQARLLEKFLVSAADYTGLTGATPFELIGACREHCLDCGKHGGDEGGVVCDCQFAAYDPLYDLMSEARLGQYRRLVRCWRESLKLDLRNDPVEAFEAIHGVGPKTARMFIMHSRPKQRLAAIDTHVLKHLASYGFTVPKATPGNQKDYRALELAFLDLADQAGMDPSEYDLMVWNSYANP